MLNSAPIKGPSQGRLPTPAAEAAAIWGLGEDASFSLSFPISALFYFFPLSPFSIFIISRFFSLSMHVFSSLRNLVSVTVSHSRSLLANQFDKHTTAIGPGPDCALGQKASAGPCLQEPQVSAFLWFSLPLCTLPSPASPALQGEGLIPGTP